MYFIAAKKENIELLFNKQAMQIVKGTIPLLQILK